MLLTRKYYKRLTLHLKTSGGRNNSGKITVRHRGFINQKRRYLLWNDKYYWLNVPFMLIKNIYKFPYSNLMSLVLYSNGFLSFIPSTFESKPGMVFCHMSAQAYSTGFGSFVRTMSLGSLIHNHGSLNNKESVFSRSAGSFSQIISKFSIKGNYILVKLKSGAEYLINCNVFSILGICDNRKHCFHKLKKAGDSRKLGRRPTVRGVAMNPIDHPHGGGEGKTSGGRCSVSYKGILTKCFYKTRKKKKYRNFALYNFRKNSDQIKVL